MAYNPTIFNQLFNFIPRHEFEKRAKEYSGDRYCKGFTCWKQFPVLLYAQVSAKNSLRDICTGLLTQQPRLYHLGMDAVPRSTLADALNRRDSKIFEGMFQSLLSRVHQYAPAHKLRFKNDLYSIDATTIDLCLSVYDWARFRQRKGAIKLHCQLDHGGHLPVFITVTDGKTHEITAIRDQLAITPDSIYCFDKAYIDYTWLYSIEKQGAFFVTRAKHNMDFRITGQHARTTKSSVLEDCYVEFIGASSFKKYPKKLRWIRFQDPKTGKIYEFLTNNFKLAASTIAAIYKQRWQIELFFKWIKQNLKIKTFLGTSRNAVLSQIWVAMIYYLLLAYIKFQSKWNHSITELSRRVSEALMHRLDLIELLALTRNPGKYGPSSDEDGQLPLFDT